MKTMIKRIFALLSLAITLVALGCRTEDDLSIDPPAEANIEKNSPLAQLMSRVALSDGSKDNIIDSASNLLVQLPVTVTVNGTVINVTNEGDYEDILDAFDESDSDDDVVNISYPITVIFPDYSTIVVNSDAELNDFAVNSDNDDDIECIDFVYPITVSVFIEQTETFETISIDNDNELFDILEILDDYTAVTINFPVTVIFNDGSEQIINSAEELEEAIEAADDTCDEDDDNDFDDCEINTYTPTYFEDSILACTEWTIDKLKRNNNSLQSEYEDYTFAFNADGTILVNENANTFNGTWEATGTEGDVDVTIDVIGLPDFNLTWNLCKINLQPVEKQIELKVGTDRLRFGSYCSDTVNASLEDILEDGVWIVASYTDDGEDETADYDGYEINFSDDGTVFATNGIITNNGTWSVFGNEGLMNLEFDSDPFDEFDDDNWDVVSVSNTQVVLQDVSGGGTDILTLQKL